MSDCANVGMRELLPDLARGALDASTRERVEAHVSRCAECAAELETVRLVRAAFGEAPRVDTARIVAGLPKPSVAPVSRRRQRMASRWMDWRVAAALTMMTIGGLSVAVTQRLRSGSDAGGVVLPRMDSAVATERTARPIDTAAGSLPRVVTEYTPSTTARREKPQLSVGGGVDDLEGADIQALLSALDEIDRAPIAPSAEPQRVTVLPIPISDDSR